MDSIVWQQIPSHLDPIAFAVGSFSIRWYAIFFMGGFIAAASFCLGCFRKEAAGFHSQEELIDTLLTLFLGALIGGRLGYVFLYNPAFFLESPLRIIWPYDAPVGWLGLSGMSFHGGLIGAAIAFVWIVKRRGLPFWQTADFFALAAPIALFFGRLGNFFNLELYGRVTEQPWGMVFPYIWPIGALRHPSALYEAALEGALLFMILFAYQRTSRFPGALFSVFLIVYACLRFVAEYFREPDLQIGLLSGGFSLGQWLSIAMLLLGMTLYGLTSSHSARKNQD